jgi:OOP family OmpA-OmpF porin
MTRPTFTTLAAALALGPLAAGPLAAAPGDQPVKPLPPAATQSPDTAKPRSASLPARGLFVGDQLSDATKARLTELILEALGMRVEVALLVPTGPWQIDGASQADNDLTAARLAALRRFLSERGVDPKRIFVESRIDAKVKEPRLDVQLVGQPAED